MFLSTIRKFLHGGSLLTLLTIIGVAIGVGLGLGLRAAKDGQWNVRESMYVKFVGDMFLRTLQGLVLPLIFCSLVSAIGSIDLTLSKKIGIRALVYYVGTTAVAVVLGLVLVVSIKPGNRAGHNVLDNCSSQNSSTVDTILDLMRNVFPPNLIGATMYNTRTEIIDENDGTPFNNREIKLNMVDGTNMLGLVVFAMVLGMTLGKMGEAGKPVLNFFTTMSEATMIITSSVVWASPLAICFLVAGQLVAQDDIATVFENLVWYLATVMAGLLIHGLILLPLLYFVLTRTLPFRFMSNMAEAMATAFGTASSSASLPVTMNCLEVNNKIDQRVSRFVLPIGATVNMNGTALYLPVGAIYISQLCGLELSIGQLISVSLISIATAVGTAGIPQVGMVIMLTVLGTIGIPEQHVAMIMPIDWLVERFRTAVNVLGDAFGAAIVAILSKSDLDKIPVEPLESIEVKANEELADSLTGSEGSILIRSK